MRTTIDGAKLITEATEYDLEPRFFEDCAVLLRHNPQYDHETIMRVVANMSEVTDSGERYFTESAYEELLQGRKSLESAFAEYD